MDIVPVTMDIDHIAKVERPSNDDIPSMADKRDEPRWGWGSSILMGLGSVHILQLHRVTEPALESEWIEIVLVMSLDLVRRLHAHRSAHRIGNAHLRHMEGLSVSISRVRKRLKIHPKAQFELVFKPESRPGCFEEDDFEVLHEFLVKEFRKAAVKLNGAEMAVTAMRCR